MHVLEPAVLQAQRTCSRRHRVGEVGVVRLRPRCPCRHRSPCCPPGRVGQACLHHTWGQLRTDGRAAAVQQSR
jgi:hypothetical protein